MGQGCRERRRPGARRRPQLTASRHAAADDTVKPTDKRRPSNDSQRTNRSNDDRRRRIPRLGRGIATALAEAGEAVIAVARTETALAELAGGDSNITPEVADATDPTVAGTLLDRYEPQEAEAARGGQSVKQFLQQLPEPLTPERTGTAVLELVGAETAPAAPAYVLTGDGLEELG